MKKIIILLFIISSISSSGTNCLDDLNKLVEIKSNQKVLVIFINIHHCRNCYYKLTDILNEVKNYDSEKSKNLIFFSYVKCDRDIELKNFIKIYNWKYYSLRDDNTKKQKLKVNEKNDIAVFNSNGKILFEANSMDENIYMKLIKVLYND